jgi:hypothetical protein
MVVSLSPQREAELLAQYHQKQADRLTEDTQNKQMVLDRAEALSNHIRKVNDEINLLTPALYQHFISKIAEPYILAKTEKGKRVCCRRWIENLGVDKARLLLDELRQGEVELMEQESGYNNSRGL